MRARLIFGASTCLCAMAGITAFLHCAPSDDMSVTIVETCDVTQLRSDPAEQTVRLYVETSNELRDRTKAIEAELIKVCNNINRESGGQEGNNLRAACGALATRLATAERSRPDGGETVPPQWIRISYPEFCAFNTPAQVECLAKCSGGAACDPAQACPAGKRQGKCTATCTGSCAAKTAGEACLGACRGGCNAPGDGGVIGCTGECAGSCNDANWIGRCEAGCDRNFVGSCGGTCTGTCNEAVVGDAGTAPPPSDAGASDAGDAGDAGGPPPPVDAGLRPAPGGEDGNCKGICTGTCSSAASGRCQARCRSGFAGGVCTTCNGSCSTPGEGCLTTCNGECVTLADDKTGTCNGTCVGECSVPMTDVRCHPGDLACEANAQCKAVCAVRAAVTARCEPPASAEVRVAGDHVLYAPLKKYAPQLAALAVEATNLNELSDRISRVTIADFKALGTNRDRVRVCVLSSGPVVAEARTTLGLIVGVVGAIRDGNDF